MKPLRSRPAAAFASAVMLATVVAGAVPTSAAPSSEPTINTTQDLKGVWMTKLKGYADGQPVQWQYRLTVRKADGTAAVAWEEWRDCAAHAAACKVGRFAGGGWSSPSRVLLAMDASKVIHGVSATGVMTLTPGPRGMTAVMLSAGQSPDLLLPTASADRVESSSRAAQSMQFDQWSSSYAVGMACTGCFVYTPS